MALSVADPGPGAVASPTARIVVRPSRRPSLPPPPTIGADMTVRYRSGPDERRLVQLEPWGAQHQLMAASRGPREHDSESRLLPLTHDPKRSPVATALRALTALYFGASGLVPRIVGEPDWLEATLTLHSDDADDGPDALLQVQLRIEGPSGLRALVRHCAPDVSHSGPVSLLMRPGDADPLHALLRVGFGTEPW